MMTRPSAEDIKITAELTPDPDVCKFIVDRVLVEDWTLIFRGRDESLGSPLIDELFQLPDVCSVRVSGHHMAVTKGGASGWPDLAGDVAKAIRKVLAAGEDPISREALAAIEEAPAGNLQSTIEQLFEHNINPALASHGGFVHLVRVEDRDIFLEMGGGCQGCAASKATLKYGIEQAVRQAAPEVRNIIDVTDHEAGANPFYT